MPTGTSSLEKIKDLDDGKQKLVAAVEELKNKSPKSLWFKDVDAIDQELDVSNAIL